MLASAWWAACTGRASSRAGAVMGVFSAALGLTDIWHNPECVHAPDGCPAFARWTAVARRHADAQLKSCLASRSRPEDVCW